MKVLSLVDRTTGQARSVVVDDLKPATIVPILEENISKEARVVTDEAGHYHYLRDSFAEHSVVKHHAPFRSAAMSACSGSRKRQRCSLWAVFGRVC